MGFLCIDIGATNTLIGIGNGDFEVVKKVSSREFLDDIGYCLENTFSEKQVDSIDRVAVAAAGPLNRDKGEFYPPNIPEMDAVQIRKPLESFGNFMIVNDCVAGVAGEYVYGSHDVEDLLYVTISSGIGAGMIEDDRVVEGWKGNFAEVGHMEIAGNGVKCGCGSYGHWEAYCSGNNLPRMAQYVTGEEFEDARTLFEQAKNGNENAEEAMEKMNEYNARAFGNLVNLYNPEKIVVGGAVALNHPSLVVEPLEGEVEDKVVNQVPLIETCELGEKSVINGLRAKCNGEI